MHGKAHKVKSHSIAGRKVAPMEAQASLTYEPKLPIPILCMDNNSRVIELEMTRFTYLRKRSSGNTLQVHGLLCTIILPTPLNPYWRRALVLDLLRYVLGAFCFGRDGVLEIHETTLTLPIR